MAIIAQKKLFGWKEIEDLGDLERLNLANSRATAVTVACSVFTRSPRHLPRRHHNARHSHTFQKPLQPKPHTCCLSSRYTNTSIVSLWTSILS